MQNELNQEAVAKKFGMSRGYFSKCFKDISGHYFHEYVRNVRMEQAKLLLAQTNLPIYQVSEQVGYQNEKHFSRIFAECFGMLPTEYRKVARDQAF